MAVNVFRNIEVKGVACAVPQNSVNNSEAEFERSVIEKFIKTVGVKKRHVVGVNQTTSDLCFVAAERVLERLDWERESIDALIFVTQGPDYILPATACVLHKRLELSQDCIAFDINLGCSSYPYGLFVASSFLQAPHVRRVLFLTGDIVNGRDKNQATAMLFGAAGSATALEKGLGEIKFDLKTDGNGYDKLIATNTSTRRSPGKPRGLTMDGPGIFEFALFDVVDTIKKYLQTESITWDDVDYCIFHQANLLILEKMAKSLKLPKDKMPISIDRYGNTSGCSLPLTLVDLCATFSGARKLNLFMSGFGVGLSWGIVQFSIDSADVLPIIYTDDYYREAY